MVRRLLILALSSFVLCSAATAPAAKIWWEEMNYEVDPLLDWGDSGNWVGGGVPASGDLASVTNAWVKIDDGATYQVNALSIAGNLGGGYGGNTYLLISDGVLNVSDTGGTTGDNASAGDVRFVNDTSGGNRTGTIEIVAGGTLNVAGNITTGSDDTGILILDGGTLNMTGGGDITVEQLYVGTNDDATYTQNGGATTAYEALTLGLMPGSSGTYNLASGSLQATRVLGGYGDSALTLADSTTLTVSAINGAVLAEDVTIGNNVSLEIVAPTTPNETYFIGALSNDWDDDANWSGGNPDGVVINAGDTIIAVGADSLSMSSLPTSVNTEWTLTQVGDAIAATYSGSGIATETTNAVILYGTAERATDLQIFNRTTSDDPDALSLEIRAGAALEVGTSAANAELILGGTEDGGKGVVNQYGDVTVNGVLRFGTVDDSEGGTYNVNGGTLTVNGDVIETNSGVDAAQLQFNAGALVVTGDITVQRFSIGEASGSDGASYTIPVGQAVHSTGSTVVGSYGTNATLEVEGTLTADGTSYIAEKAGSSGTVTIDAGGMADFNGALNIGCADGAVGLVEVLGGEMEGSTVNIGSGANGQGTLNSENATLTVADLNIASGAGAQGDVTIDGGSLTSTGGIDVASNAAGTGTLTVTNGAVLNVSGGNFETGLTGVGRVVWEDGTLNQTTSNVIVGQNTGSDATFETYGGTLEIAGQLRVTNKVDINGRFLLYGGTANVGGQMDTFNTAGTNTTGIARIEVDDTHAGSNAPAVLNVAADLVLGNTAVDGGDTQFDVKSGTVNVAGDLLLSVGTGNVSVTNVTGGAVNVAGNVDYQSGGTDTINVAGGTLTMTGGGSVLFQDDTDRLNLTDGTLNMGGGILRPTTSGSSADRQFNFTGGRLQGLHSYAALSGTVADQSGSGYDGTLSSGAGPAVPGAVNKAIQLDGNDGFIDFGDVDEMDSAGEFSVAMWFQRTADNSTTTVTNHDVANVLLAQSSNDTNDNFELGTLDEEVEIYMDCGGGSGFDGKLTTTGAGITNGDWNHLVVTYDKNDGDGNGTTLDLYLNGTFLEGFSDPTGNLDSSSTSSLSIGVARPENQAWGDYTGLVDDFGLWTRQLSDTEIADLYATSVADADATGLLIYTTMDSATYADNKLLQNGGTIAPGESVGTTYILGDYELTGGGIYEIEIDGLASNDLIDVAGDAVITDGILDVILDGYSPEVNETFDVLTASNITVDSLSILQSGDYVWRIVAGGNGQILQLTHVPEPSSLTLAALGLLAAAFWGWRRRK